MVLFGRKKKGPASIVVISLAGREDLLPDFAYPLTETVTTIGRHDSATIQVVDGLISRQHVQIRLDPAAEAYLASDMKSANGTLINGEKIRMETPLTEGDVIEIGNSRLVFTRRRFKDHDSALKTFTSAGEQVRSTLVKVSDPPE